MFDNIKPVSDGKNKKEEKMRGAYIFPYEWSWAKKAAVTLLIFVAVFLLAFILSEVKAHAEDFGRTFTRATIESPPGADPASMGNAQVAETPDYSSYNSSTLDAGTDFKAGASGSYLVADFGSGPKLRLWSGTVTGKLPKGFGVIQLSYANAWSRLSPTEIGTDLKLKSAPVLSIQYGVKVAGDVFKKGDKLFVGATYNPISKSDLLIVLAEGGIRSKSSGYSLGASALYQYDDKLNVGAYYSHGHSKANDESVSNSDQWRIGASYHVTSTTYVAADLDRTTIDGSGKIKWYFGIEQGIIKDFFYIYGGLADGFNKPTVGLGVYTKNVGINLAYMHKYYEDLAKFLGGQGNVYMATAYLRF